MNGLPLWPTIITDIAGSAANIVFAFLALRYAWLLTRKQPENFLWGFLFYFCMALAAFSLSRAAGHLVKQFLFMSGNEEIWRRIAPFSGGFNTMLLISASAVTIFYNKGVQAYQAVEQKAAQLKSANLKLEIAARKMQELNQNLEEKVEERTAELSKSEKKFRHLCSSLFLHFLHTLFSASSSSSSLFLSFIFGITTTTTIIINILRLNNNYMSS